MPSQGDEVSDRCGAIVLADRDGDRRARRLAFDPDIDDAIGVDLFDRLRHDRNPEPFSYQVNGRGDLWCILPQNWTESCVLAGGDDTVVQTGPDCPRNRMNVSPAKEASETERKLACGWFEGSTIRMGSSTSGSTLRIAAAPRGARKALSAAFKSEAQRRS
jgi:hypothetical protein